MRQILFKGKRKDNGEWVEGYYYLKQYRYKGVDKIDFINHTITTGITETSGKYDETSEDIEYGVIPETVGQYTGLKDKNGNMIFEGDIVRCWTTGGEFTAIVVFGNPNSTYNWGWGFVRISGCNDYNLDILLWVDMECTGACCEIIGNTHDNPDLIE